MAATQTLVSPEIITPRLLVSEFKAIDTPSSFLDYVGIGVPELYDMFNKEIDRICEVGSVTFEGIPSKKEWEHEGKPYEEAKFDTGERENKRVIEVKAEYYLDPFYNRTADHPVIEYEFGPFRRLDLSAPFMAQGEDFVDLSSSIETYGLIHEGDITPGFKYEIHNKNLTTQELTSETIDFTVDPSTREQHGERRNLSCEPTQRQLQVLAVGIQILKSVGATPQG